MESTLMSRTWALRAANSLLRASNSGAGSPAFRAMGLYKGIVLEAQARSEVRGQIAEVKAFRQQPCLRCRVFFPLLKFVSPDQHRPTVHVEHFPGNESRMRCAEKQNRCGDFLGRSHASQRNAAE